MQAAPHRGVNLASMQGWDIVVAENAIASEQYAGLECVAEIEAMGAAREAHALRADCDQAIAWVLDSRDQSITAIGDAIAS
jgi:hypothetical protein